MKGHMFARSQAIIALWMALIPMHTAFPAGTRAVAYQVRDTNGTVHNVYADADAGWFSLSTVEKFIRWPSKPGVRAIRLYTSANTLTNRPEWVRAAVTMAHFHEIDDLYQYTANGWSKAIYYNQLYNTSGTPVWKKFQFTDSQTGSTYMRRCLTKQQFIDIVIGDVLPDGVFAGSNAHTQRVTEYEWLIWQLIMQPDRHKAARASATQMKNAIGATLKLSKLGNSGTQEFLTWVEQLSIYDELNYIPADTLRNQIDSIRPHASQLEVFTQTVGTALNVLSAIMSAASHVEAVSNKAALDILYAEIVQTTEAELRLRFLEALAARHDFGDPAILDAIARTRTAFDALYVSTSGDSSEYSSAFIEFMRTNPTEATRMLTTGVSFTASSASLLVSLLSQAGVISSSTASVLGGGLFVVTLLYDVVSGWDNEYQVTSNAGLALTFAEHFEWERDRLLGESWTVVDLQRAYDISLLDSLETYNGYLFYQTYLESFNRGSSWYGLISGFWQGVFDILTGNSLAQAMTYMHERATANLYPGEWYPAGYYHMGILSGGYPHAVTEWLALIGPAPLLSPAAAVHSISPSSITRGDGSVTFDGSTSAVTTPDATLSTYRWISNLDGQLYSGSSSSFSRNSAELSAGQHNITLQVRDSNGLWSDNTAQSTLYVYEPGPDAGHDLAVWSVDLDTTVIPVNSSVRADLLIRNDGSHTESDFDIRYRLLRSDGTVMDEQVESTTVVWEPGQIKGPGYVYLSASGGYQGPATVEILIENALDENRSNNSASLGLFVGAPPVYDGYYGGSWTVYPGTGNPVEDPYTLEVLVDYGNATKIRITKGTTSWEQQLNVNQLSFFDANQLAVLYAGKATSGGSTRYYYTMLINNAAEAWLDSKYMSVTETDETEFIVNRLRTDSTWQNQWAVANFGDGATIRSWNPEESRIDDYRRRLRVTPPLGAYGHYDFWIINSFGYDVSVSTTTRGRNSMAVRAALTVHKDFEPSTAITDGPTGTNASRTALFLFTGSDDRTPVANLTYSYRLVGHQDAWSAYSSDTSTIYTDLPNGTYTFEVRAKDNAGQVDPSPASRTFTVDVQHPPSTPSHISPTHGAILAAARGVELMGGAFVDPDPDASHEASEFRIRTDSGDYSEPLWSSGVVGGFTTVNVDPGSLQHPGQFWWQCRYRDNTGRWSEWSGETSFSLLANNPPIANSRNETAVHSRSTVIPLPATDPDGDPIIGEIVNGPMSGGTAVMTGPLSVTYTPPPGYIGDDSFTYRVSDGLLESETASVNISVINRPPVANAVIAVVESGKRTTLSLPASDADGDQLSYSIQRAPVEGVLYTDALSSGRVDYQSPAGYNDDVMLTYSVSDGIADATGTVTIVVSDPENMSIDLVYDALGRLSVRYPAIAGLTYKVWYCNILGDTWTELTSGIIGDGTLKLATDIEEQIPPSRFYMVTVDLP